MIRVVLDTNIVVSAMLNPSGTAADCLRLGLAGHVQLCVSNPILEEYEGVLLRPKFKRSPKAVSAMLRDIRMAAVSVRPTTTLAISADEEDNRFLECAETAEAEYLVTGNTQHFPETWRKIRIITPRQLVELVTPKP
jgi:putative PIN family toxin of toxin-antitoxin system